MRAILFLGLLLFIFPSQGNSQNKCVKYYLYADSCFKKGDYKQAFQNFKIARDNGNKSVDLEYKLKRAQKCMQVNDSLVIVMQAGLYQIGRRLLSKILRINSYDKNAQVKMLEINDYLRNRPNDMVFIQGRIDNKKPVNDFFIAINEVTVADYCKFLNIKMPDSTELMTWININNSSQIRREGAKFVVKEGQNQFPVVNVSWQGAKAYALLFGLDLPTLSEWNLATTEINRDLDLSEIAWSKSNSNLHLHKVKTRRQQKNGVYDLIGNAWEWTTDSYVNPAVYGYSHSQRVAVGGSYGVNLHNMKKLQNYYREDEKLPNVGFRCVKHIRIPVSKGKSFYN